MNNHPFLQLYGVTQDPETKEYMIVMQYAINGNLLSYLDRNIKKLTWKRKVNHLMNIAYRLSIIHNARLVHTNLHGGNIVVRDGKSLICDLGLSHSVNSRKSNPNIQGDITFIA